MMDVEKESLQKKLEQELQHYENDDPDEIEVICVLVSALKAVRSCASSIQKRIGFLKNHQLETNMAQSFDWNIGYNHGINKAIDELEKQKKLLVGSSTEESKE